jgi:hypothetical protein
MNLGEGFMYSKLEPFLPPPAVPPPLNILFLIKKINFSRKLKIYFMRNFNISLK